MLWLGKTLNLLIFHARIEHTDNITKYLHKSMRKKARRTEKHKEHQTSKSSFSKRDIASWEKQLGLTHGRPYIGTRQAGVTCPPGKCKSISATNYILSSNQYFHSKTCITVPEFFLILQGILAIF